MLIVGASNQISYFLLRALADGGEVATVVSRRPPPVAWPAKSVRWLEGGLQDAHWRGARRCVFLAPLSLIPANLPQTLEHLIAVSTTSVVTKLASEDPTERALVSEIAAQERRLQRQCAEQGIALNLVRPTLVYGCGRDANIARVARWATRWPCLPLPRNARGCRQPVHAQDLAQAILALADRPTAKTVLTLPGGERLAYAQMVKRVAQACDSPARLLFVPAAVLHFASYAIGRRRGRAMRAMLSRMSQDLCFEDDDWRLLGIKPRGFELDALALGQKDSV